MHSSQKHRHHGHESGYSTSFVLPHPASTGLDGRATGPASATTMAAATTAVEDRFYPGRRPGSNSGSTYRSHHPLNSSTGTTNDGGMNHHGNLGIHYAAEPGHHHHQPTLPTLQNTQPSHFPTMMAHSTGHSPELTQPHPMGYPPSYLR